MQKISRDFADELMNHSIIGYSCDAGVVGMDNEFIVLEKDDDLYLVHECEIVREGCTVRLKNI